jgi:hypothetical protein
VRVAGRPATLLLRRKISGPGMSTPLWQFWTDWTVKTLGTLATFLAVLVALFGERWRHRMSPPRLKLELSSREGMLAELHGLDRASNEATPRSTRGLWFHMRASNETRWKPVTGVHIFLRSIEAPDSSGEFQLIWEGNTALGWRHEPDKKPKTIGPPVESDLCHILKDPLQVRLSPIISGQVPDTFTKSFKFILTLQARGIEIDSSPRRIAISWDGEWSDDRAELARHHFVVKEA